MKKDIAIIGMSGRFPKSANLEAFWQNLVDGKELIHFFTDAELAARGVDGKKRERPHYVKAASFVTGTDEFDYPLFKYTVHEARVMNPQTRMMHQLVWEALEDAACNVERYNKKVGIFLGANKDLAWSFHATVSKTEHVDDLTKRKMANPNFMASLIAYKLNFKGPCYFVDTACSTSLGTAHLACRSLLLNECGIAVAGGIRLLSEEDTGYVYQEGTIVSKDGHNRSFDREASGTVPCDGAGVVILKRVEDALKDNDHIYAVIRGSAMNNDGNDKAGYTMPGVNGQAECIRLAQKIAGVAPAEISYVETHGTGTRIGDPIEIEALNQAFDNDTRHSCAIGTVKSNMGHADEAAGVAGLIKTTLALKHRVIPASLHYQSPNPTIPFGEGPFRVNHATVPWGTAAGALRIAGVSSLGIGGTNVHLILQEAPERPRGRAGKGYALVGYSAQTEAALDRYETKLLHFLKRTPGVDLADVAYTLQVGRKHFGHRRYVIARDTAELVNALEAGNVKTHAVKPRQQVVFMFSGQGSQYANMGRQLYDAYPAFREVLDQGFARLRELMGVDCKEVLFSDDGEAIHETFYTQPILFLFEYALAQLLMGFGVRPQYLIGHSLGEYVAATLAGVFTLEDALKVVSARARLMAGVAAGDMISVGAPLRAVEKALGGGAAVAAVNAPDSFVLSGTRPGMAAVRAQLAAEEIPFVALKTSHAFHSGMMREIAGPFEQVLRSVRLNAPQLPVVSNLTGELLTAAQAVSPAYWSDHLLGTVQFEKGIGQLMALDQPLFVEVGPGRTLAAFCRKSGRSAPDHAVLTTVRHPREAGDDEWFLAHFLAQLGTHGVEVDWHAYYGAHLPAKISLPTYAFEPHSIPAKVALNASLLHHQAATRGDEPVTEAFYLPSWKYLPAKPERETPFAGSENYLVFHDGSAFCDGLVGALEAGDKKVVEVRKGEGYDGRTPGKIAINPADPRDYRALADGLADARFDFNCLVYAWGLGDAPAPLTGYQACNRTFDDLLRLVTGLALADAADPRKIVFLSNKNYAVTGAENVRTFNQHAVTLLHVLSQESPNLYAAAVDLDLDDDWGKAITGVCGACEDGARFSQAAFRSGRRWVPYYEPLAVEAEDNAEVIRPGGAYLFTGSLDDMEYALAGHLLTGYGARVVFLSPEPQGQKGQQLLEKLAALPGTVHFAAADLSDYEACRAQVERVEARYGPIRGVIHSARHSGVDGFAFTGDITRETIAQHFAPRVNGLITLDRVFRDRPPDFIAVFSSLSAFLGGVSYGAYAAAASLMDHLALYARQTDTRWAVVNLDRVHQDAPWIQEGELVAVFYAAFQYAGPERLVVSRRNLQAPPADAPRQEATRVAVEMDRNQLKSAYKAPGNETESRLVQLFGELFGIGGLGVEDDFFELGGDSLKAVVLINRLKKEMGVEITVADMFANKTARDLSLLVAEKKWLGEEKNRVNELII